VAGSLAFLLLGAQAQPQPEPVQAQAQPSQQSVAEQAIPDAPKPQTTLPGLGSVAPGQGSTSTSNGDTEPGDTAGTPPAALPSSPATAQGSGATQAGDEQTTVNQPPAGQGVLALTLMVPVNFVEVPFTVLDSKGVLVPGLTGRDVHVYESGLPQHIAFFTADPFPLSVALVIDQSMTYDNMVRVNDALGALQGAFAAYDEVAVFTYNNGPRMVTDFTGAQSARLTQAVERSKTTGRDSLMAGSLSGPLAQTTVVNDQNFDPNTAANRGHTSMQLDTPKEVHTLNDAILKAAVSLSTRPRGRRRVIYVISDGREYGSTAKYKDVVRYLQANRIGVYGTLVGDSSLPVVGYLDRIHLPLMMRDNILPSYAGATGGIFDAEFRTGAIERSFAQIAKEVRAQYTLGYYTHEPFIDGKYRKVEVIIMNHGSNLTVLAKPGYWPSAMEMRPRPTTPSQ